MDQITVTLVIDKIDGELYVSSPDVPGLHVAGPLLSALGWVGLAMCRLIRDNKVEQLYPLLPSEGAGSKQ